MAEVFHFSENLGFIFFSKVSCKVSWDFPGGMFG